MSHLYLLPIIKFPFTFKHFSRFIFKLFIFYFPLANLASVLFRSFSEFFFSLLPKWSNFIFWFFYVHYHEIEKFSFLKNDLDWFKQLTLATSSLFLFSNECTGIIMNSFHLFLVFPLYEFLPSLPCFSSLSFLNKVFFAATKI